MGSTNVEAAVGLLVGAVLVTFAGMVGGASGLVVGPCSAVWGVWMWNR